MRDLLSDHRLSRRLGRDGTPVATLAGGGGAPNAEARRATAAFCERWGEKGPQTVPRPSERDGQTRPALPMLKPNFCVLTGVRFVTSAT